MNLRAEFRGQMPMTGMGRATDERIGLAFVRPNDRIFDARGEGAAMRPRVVRCGVVRDLGVSPGLNISF